MRFIADVNIAQTIVRGLRRERHDVIDVKKENPKISDIELIKLSLQEKCIILTHDNDFLALTQYPKYQTPVIVIRLREQNARHFWAKLKDLIKHQSEEIINASLTILKEESADSYPYGM